MVEVTAVFLEAVHLETFEKFPPLQPPESYNLSSIMAEVKKAASQHPSD